MEHYLGVFFQVGGVKSLESLLQDLSSCAKLTLWGRPPVVDYLGSKGIAAQIVTEEKILKTSFDQFSIVVTDTINMARCPDAPLLGKIWGATAKASVPSLAFVDSWWGYDNRFTYPEQKKLNVLPSLIAVVDQIAHQGMIKAGHSPDILKILGSPYLDSLRAQRSRAQEKKQKFRRDLGLKKEFVCLFVSQPLERALPGGALHWGFNEFTTLKAISEQAKQLPCDIQKNFRLLVLPHPEDNISVLENEVRQLPLTCRVLPKYNPLDAVCGSDLVCGMFSILLAEAALLGRVVLSVQLNLSCEDMLITNIVGATQCARTNQDLKRMFIPMVCNPEYRNKSLTKQELFTVVGNSHKRWNDQLKSMRVKSR